MEFVSTRNAAPPLSASQAVMQGLAPDGGLYIPEALPVLSKAALDPDAPYPERARAVLDPFSRATNWRGV